MSVTKPAEPTQGLAEKLTRDDSALATAAAELWALLHNGRRPEGYWDEASERYYKHVVLAFVSSPALPGLLQAAGAERLRVEHQGGATR